MRRSQGATLSEIMELTGWQAHTVRGFVSGTDHATFYTPLLRT
jgi:hypothetical protein